MQKDAGPDTIVVGAGISGLAAAWRLHRLGARVTVLEESGQVGGKLMLGRVGGLEVDLGAESFLARRPEALDLIAELSATARPGLVDDLVHPVTAAARVLRGGRLHPLPPGTVMGIPVGAPGVVLTGLTGLLNPDEVARVAAEPLVPAPALSEDVDVASFVRHRFGPAVPELLVEPLLGGVYAGRAECLSLAATVPQVWQRARAGGPLLVEPPAAPAAPAAPAGAPVFAGLRGGVGRLPGELAAALDAAGVAIRTQLSVHELSAGPTGWRVRAAVAGRPDEYLDADAVVLAVPAPQAARLVRDISPVAAARLSGIRVADVAVVAAWVPRGELAGLSGSGVLVPPTQGHSVKAITCSSAKWAWTDALGGELALIRMSLGRDGETAVLQRDDAELTALAVADAGRILGRPIRPVADRVVRWTGSLPQYEVGHLSRVADIRRALGELPGLAICGAALDGVGIPACIASADRAAREALRPSATMAG